MAPEAPGPAGELSLASLQRLTSFLLIIAAGLLTAVIGLSLYIVLDKRATAELKGSLLAQQQLQSELLASQDSDHAPYPHLAEGVSYVLNPAMQQATWKTGRNKAYRINRIGLRGAEIRAKADGVKRIALVGDSVLFGWKLADDDRLASLLQAMADERLGKGRYEFVTIALPGWNIIDQERFLRSHMARLDPDYIVWSIIRNDLLDSGGVIPPGMLAAWNSPQKSLEQAFQFLPPGQLRDVPAPALLARWESNLRLINDFATEHAVATSLLWWRARHRPVFDYVLARSGVELPELHIPEQYRYDDKQWCVAFPDCHPTRWANEHLAIGIMDELVRRNIVSRIQWNEDEKQVAAAFVEARENTPDASEQQAFLQAQALKVPESFDADESSAVIFGVRETNMERNGLLLLRNAGAATLLEMTVEAPWPRPGPPLQMDIRIEGAPGAVVQATHILPQASNSIRMTLPKGSEFGIVQVEWQFNFSECQRPSACYSAKLESARLLEMP